MALALASLGALLRQKQASADITPPYLKDATPRVPRATWARWHAHGRPDHAGRPRHPRPDQRFFIGPQRR
jgi:hypothetical protein